MRELVVSIIGGLEVGATYALMASGLVVVFRATQVLNFAHGNLMMLAAYVAAVLCDTGVNFWLAALAGFAAAGATAGLFFGMVGNRMVGLPHFMPVIATIGLAAVIDAAVGLWVGSKQYVLEVPGLPTGAVRMFGVRITSESLLLFAVIVAVLIALILLTEWTDFGRRLRAAGQDPGLAAQSGIHVPRLYFGAWLLAGCLAALAGITYAATNIVGPGIVPLALLAFPAMLLGGMDSLRGALVGGLCVGLLEGFTATYLGGESVSAVTYTVLLVVLLVAPQGLMGTIERQKL